MAAKEKPLEISLPVESRTQLRRLASDIGKSSEQAGPSIEKLVALGTTDTSDMLSLLSVQNVLCWHLANGNKAQKEQAKEALVRIDKYYREAKITHKYFLPLGMPINTGREYLIKTINDLRPSTEKIDKSDLKNSEIGGFTTVEVFSQLTQLLPKLKPEDNTVVVAITSIIPMRRYWSVEGIPFADVMENYSQVFLASDLEARMELQSERKLQVPDKLLRAVLTPPQKPSPVLERLYNRKFNGVSLGSLFLDTDENKIGAQILRYVAGLQRGNPQLMRMADGLFFISQHLDLNTEFDKLFKLPKHIDKIYTFQRWLTSNLVMPALSSDWQTPPDFDNQVSALFNYFDDIGLAEIGSTIYYALNRGAYAHKLTHAGTTLGESMATLPYVVEAMKYKENLEGKHRVAIVDQDVHDYIKHNWETIKANWKQRFGDTEKLSIVLETLDEYFKSSLLALHTDELLGRLTTYTGTKFLERLKDRELQVKVTTQLMWHDTFSADRRVGYALTPDIEHTLTFSQNSFPEIVGLNNIRFLASNDPSEGILFAIETKNPIMTVSGLLDPHTGALSRISMELTEDQTYLATLIHHIASAAYHDIIYRQLPPTGEVNLQPSKMSEIHHREIAEPHRDSPRTRRTRKIAALRKYRIRQKSKPEPLNTSSDELVQNIATRKDRVILQRKWREPHPSLLPFAVPYIQIRRIYMECPADEKDEIAVQLLAAQAKIAKASEDKLTELPERFELEYGYDPLTGAKINLGTWTKGHWWPRLEGDDDDTLPTSYKKDYSGGRSAISSLNMLKNWIIE